MEPRTWTVEDHLAGQPAGSVALFWRLVEMLEECGPFSYSVTKTIITFKGVRRGFAGARPARRGLSAYLDLQRVIEDRRAGTRFRLRRWPSASTWSRSRPAWSRR